MNLSRHARFRSDRFHSRLSGAMRTGGDRLLALEPTTIVARTQYVVAVSTSGEAFFYKELPAAKAAAMPRAANIAAGSPEAVLGEDQEPAERSGHGQSPLAHPAQEAAPRQADIGRQPLCQIRHLV